MPRKQDSGATKVRKILQELKAVHPQGFAAMARHVCPHSFGFRNSMKGKCAEWDGCFEPPFCEACWKEALEDE